MQNRELSDLILQDTKWRYEVSQYYFHGEDSGHQSAHIRYTIKGFYGNVAIAQVRDCDLDWAKFILEEFKKSFPRGKVVFPKITIHEDQMMQLKRSYLGDDAYYKGLK